MLKRIKRRGKHRNDSFSIIDENKFFSAVAMLGGDSDWLVISGFGQLYILACENASYEESAIRAISNHLIHGRSDVIRAEAKKHIEKIENLKKGL